MAAGKDSCVADKVKSEMIARRSLVFAAVKGALAGSATLAVYAALLMRPIAELAFWHMTLVGWLLAYIKAVLVIFPAALIVAAIAAIGVHFFTRARTGRLSKRETRWVLAVSAIMGCFPYAVMVLLSMNDGITISQIVNITLDLAVPTSCAAIIGAVVLIHGIRPSRHAM
jgi:hypothetical protein